MPHSVRSTGFPILSSSRFERNSRARTWLANQEARSTFTLFVPMPLQPIYQQRFAGQALNSGLQWSEEGLDARLWRQLPLLALSLQAGDETNAPLNAIATAGKGTMLTAQDPAALTDVDPSLLEALGEAAARGGAGAGEEGIVALQPARALEAGGQLVQLTQLLHGFVLAARRDAVAGPVAVGLAVVARVVEAVNAAGMQDRTTFLSPTLELFVVMAATTVTAAALVCAWLDQLDEHAG